MNSHAVAKIKRQVNCTKDCSFYAWQFVNYLSNCRYKLKENNYEITELLNCFEQDCPALKTIRNFILLNRFGVVL